MDDLKTGKLFERVKAGKESLDKALRERVKELDCLYRVSKSIQKNDKSIAAVLDDLTVILPRAWQYPEVACIRIEFKGDVYTSANFQVSGWKQSASIDVFGEKYGDIEIYYLEERPSAFEGPFLKEERFMLNTIAEQISNVAEKILSQQELLIERRSLQDTNESLHDFLKQSQREKRLFGAMIQAKIDKILMPIINELEGDVDKKQRIYLSLLKKNLGNIVAPFVEEDKSIIFKLTHTELLICNMIRSGMTTKEISHVRGISLATVNRHRESIRKKLKLTNRKINLRNYLNLTLEDQVR